MQNQVDQQMGRSQNSLNDLRNNLVPQNQDLQNRFAVSADRSNSDYNNIQGNYNSYLGNVNSYMNKVNDPGTFSASPLYANFMETGGYSPQDIAAMRQRGEGAVRSTFDSAKRNLEKNNRVQGGNSPGYQASIAKLTRDTARQVGDEDNNLEAQLAESIRSGKLAGAQGATGIDTARMQGNQFGLGAQLSGNQGLTSLYGTTPGMTNMYGNQLSQSNSQMNQLQQLQQAISQMILGGQQNVSQTPGNYQQALGNIGGTLGLGGQVAGMFAGL